MTTDTSRPARVAAQIAVVAGPFYLAAGLAQALTRDGFDLTRHAWSLLSNGELGWIQVGNFLLTGLLVLAGAAGLRGHLAGGRGRTWAPLLIGVFGLSMIGAGLFRADPAQGFPAGAPEQPTSMSWHGMLHFMVGGVGFLCLIAACFVLGSRYARAGRVSRAWASRLTGIVFLAGFAGIASGSHGPTTVGFLIAVAVAFAWLTSVFRESAGFAGAADHAGAPAFAEASRPAS